MSPYDISFIKDTKKLKLNRYYKTYYDFFFKAASFVADKDTHFLKFDYFIYYHNN